MSKILDISESEIYIERKNERKKEIKKKKERKRKKNERKKAVGVIHEKVLIEVDNALLKLKALVRS